MDASNSETPSESSRRGKGDRLGRRNDRLRARKAAAPAKSGENKQRMGAGRATAQEGDGSRRRLARQAHPFEARRGARQARFARCAKAAPRHRSRAEEQVGQSRAIGHAEQRQRRRIRVDDLGGGARGRSHRRAGPRQRSEGRIRQDLVQALAFCKASCKAPCSSGLASPFAFSSTMGHSSSGDLGARMDPVRAEQLINRNVRRRSPFNQNLNTFEARNPYLIHDIWRHMHL